MNIATLETKFLYSDNNSFGHFSSPDGNYILQTVANPDDRFGAYPCIYSVIERNEACFYNVNMHRNGVATWLGSD